MSAKDYKIGLNHLDFWECYTRLAAVYPTLTRERFREIVDAYNVHLVEAARTAMYQLLLTAVDNAETGKKRKDEDGQPL
jgi:hypothetical protein